MSGIKKIKVEDLRIGMFLVGFDGNWLASPFWRSRLLLDNADDVRAAHASGLQECWIDLDRGCDTAPARKSRPAPARRGVAEVLHNTRAKPVPVTLAQELPAAGQLCEIARQSILAVFSHARLGNAINTGVCDALVEDIVDSVARHPGALVSLTRLKSEDDYTYMHSVAVCALMVALARAMKLGEAEVREAGLAGLLHDIGKAKVPLHILNKPGSLDDIEFETVKRHPEHGYEALLKGDASEQVRLACLHHHERMDGNGYPQRQRGDAIPLMARMAAVCDVYDAITSDRPYKKGWDPADALARMISWQGHFDPKILATFIGVVGIYPAGSLVRLKSGRLAVVMEQSPGQFTKPVVKVFHCALTGLATPHVLIDLSKDTEDAITGTESGDAWPRAAIDQLWAEGVSAIAPLQADAPCGA